eukprot:4659258-Amphidinium_carterae.3
MLKRIHCKGFRVICTQTHQRFDGPYGPYHIVKCTCTKCQRLDAFASVGLLCHLVTMENLLEHAERVVMQMLMQLAVDVLEDRHVYEFL